MLLNHEAKAVMVQVSEPNPCTQLVYYHVLHTLCQ